MRTGSEGGPGDDWRQQLPSGGITGQVVTGDWTVPVTDFWVRLDDFMPIPFHDIEGRFRLAAAPGRVRVMLGATGQSRVVRDVGFIEVPIGETADLGKQYLEVGRRVTGEVLDESNAPVVGARVFCAQQIPMYEDGQPFVGVPESVTGTAGEFLFEGAFIGKLVLTAACPDARRSALVTVPAGTDDQRVQLVCAAEGRLAGRMLCGSVPCKAGKVLLGPDRLHAPAWIGTLAEDGTFAFEHVGAGSYLLTAWPLPMEQGWRCYLEQHVSLDRAEDKSVEVRVPVGDALLEATVVTGNDNAAVTATVWVASGTFTARTLAGMSDEAGARDVLRKCLADVSPGQPVKLGGLAPGQYTVFAFPRRDYGVSAGQKPPSLNLLLHPKTVGLQPGTATAVEVLIADEEEDEKGVPRTQ
ncbi:MAG: carboxypeptidase regulatory-like domain-containing protein [Deltaproteobacteria bacterium]|nr:carboxypeptidase regulatory-like domain-containing protein [Deltaproteobacteria bacterium]